MPVMMTSDLRTKSNGSAHRTRMLEKERGRERGRRGWDEMRGEAHRSCIFPLTTCSHKPLIPFCTLCPNGQTNAHLSPDTRQAVQTWHQLTRPVNYKKRMNDLIAWSFGKLTISGQTRCYKMCLPRSLFLEWIHAAAFVSGFHWCFLFTLQLQKGWLACYNMRPEWLSSPPNSLLWS